MTKVERHIAVLQLARDCVALGARHRTVRVVTRLSDVMLSELFSDQKQWRRMGRTPSLSDNYFRESLTDRAEISLFANLFEQVFTDAQDAGHALVTAYRLYLRYCGVRPRVLFDVAFVFAGELRGLWLADKPRLTLAFCSRCRLASVVGAGTSFVVQCPYCKIVERYPVDRRLRDHFSATVPAPSKIIARARPTHG